MWTRTTTCPLRSLWRSFSASVVESGSRGSTNVTRANQSFCSPCTRDYRLAKLQPEIVVFHFRDFFMVHALAQIQCWIARRGRMMPGYVLHRSKLVYLEEKMEVTIPDVDLQSYDLLVVCNWKVLVNLINEELELIEPRFIITFDETPIDTYAVMSECVSLLGKKFLLQLVAIISLH